MGNSTATIIVVDDEPALGTIATRILTGAGYRVLTATSGEQALALLDASPGTVDLVLTDVVMPGISGPDLAIAVRERMPTVRVIFTSGFSDDIVANGGIAGALFLSKPYTIDQLRSAVASALAS